MAIWHPGSGLSWQQYLQAESFVSDVTGQIRQSGERVGTVISDQTKQIVASNASLERSFGEGFNSLNGTLEWGINRIDSSLTKIEYSIEDLHADFNYNMGLLLASIDTQNRLLSGLLDKLDQIHKTLESPLLTQARELYRIASERLARGLLDKALEAFLEAETKNDTDFFTQYHIGNLYLYGVNSDCNVIDPHKARQHFLNAARYAKAEMSLDPSFRKLAAQSYLHASIANYALTLQR